MWLYEKGKDLPTMTIIGSSNFSKNILSDLIKIIDQLKEMWKVSFIYILSVKSSVKDYKMKLKIVFMKLSRLV